MKELQFPPYEFKIRSEKGREELWDDFRKIWVVLTPEEWVRQHVLHYLVDHKGFPKGRCGVEIALQVGDMKKRADIIVYDEKGRPLFLVECKAPEVKITQAAFDQAARYNLALRLPYMMVTNGHHIFAAEIHLESATHTFLSEIPNYDSLKAN